MEVNVIGVSSKKLSSDQKEGECQFQKAQGSVKHYVDPSEAKIDP